MYNRYNDIEKFITDVDKLELTKYGEVYISREEDYDIAVDLEEQKDKFEKLKPKIAYVAKHICEMDNMVQRYIKKCTNVARKEKFEDYLAYVYIDEPNLITFLYYGAHVNTEYLVEFEHREDKFILKSFGIQENIPEDWDNE